MSLAWNEAGKPVAGAAAPEAPAAGRQSGQRGRRGVRRVALPGAAPDGSGSARAHVEHSPREPGALASPKPARLVRCAASTTVIT